jgi:uncharacterized protein (TIGR02118 family)
MVKLVFCARRLPHLSRAEFQAYWHETHGPLVRRHAATLRIRRYVQVHMLDHPVQDGLRASRGGPEPYDGVAELWWDSLDDLDVAQADAAGRAASRELLADERRFIDLARSPVFVGEERVVVGD